MARPAAVIRNNEPVTPLRDWPTLFSSLSLSLSLSLPCSRVSRPNE